MATFYDFPLKGYSAIYAKLRELRCKMRDQRLTYEERDWLDWAENYLDQDYRKAA
jgi:hypothetical protein